MTWLGLALAAPISLLSDRIVAILFGARFQEAGSVLIISCWAAIFLFQGVARGRWMVTENLQRYSYWYIGAGAVVNVCLNVLWIPAYGIRGAAWATLLSQATVAIGAPLLLRETRVSAIMLLKSFLPWHLWTPEPAERRAPR
jgi:O-antigen/teichoic acid export membrane protein